MNWKEDSRLRKWSEHGVLWAILLSTGLVAAAAVLSVSGLMGAFPVALGALGVILGAAALFQARELDMFRIVLRPSGSSRYEQLRRVTKVRVASILLSLLIVTAGVALLVGFAMRVGLVGTITGAQASLNLLWLLCASLAAAVAYAHYQSLRFPLERETGGMSGVYAAVGLVVAATIALFSLLAPGLATDLGLIRPHDGPSLLLAALTLTGLALFPARGLPTPYRIFTHDPTKVHGPVHYSRTKGVLMPVLTAFGLLFVLLLLFTLFGLGVLRTVDEAAESALIMAFLGILVFAIAGSFAASFYFARQEDRPVLYKRPRSREEKLDLLMLSFSLVGASVVLVLALFMAADWYSPTWMPTQRWVDLVAVACLIGVGPIGFYRAQKARRVRRMEDRFPDFLRDIASSHKGGLTLASAVRVAAKGDYGELTPEINKMADQLSWNVGFEEALQRFGEGVNTPVVKRSVGLILEASRSGGSTVDVLQAAGRDAREIKNLENKRRFDMTLYVAVIYVTFFVFLAVVTVLYSRFVPEIIAASQATATASATGMASMGIDAPSLLQYRSLYYLAAIVQAVGNGVVAGLMATGRVFGGLRHAFFMVASAFVLFTLFMY